MQINGILNKIFELCASHPEEVVDYWFQHVDDVSCLLIGPEELIKTVAEELIPIFLEASKEQQLIVSPQNSSPG